MRRRRRIESEKRNSPDAVSRLRFTSRETCDALKLRSSLKLAESLLLRSLSPERRVRHVNEAASQPGPGPSPLVRIKASKTDWRRIVAPLSAFSSQSRLTVVTERLISVELGEGSRQREAFLLVVNRSVASIV